MSAAIRRLRLRAAPATGEGWRLSLDRDDGVETQCAFDVTIPPYFF